MSLDFLAFGYGSHRVPCPECKRGARDTTLGVTRDSTGAVFHCFRCGLAGAQRPTCRTGAYPSRLPIRVTSAAGGLEWSPRAESIWRGTVPIRATLAQTYLEHRQCVLPPADGALRFLPPRGKYPPSLCALVSDARSGRPLTLHFTKLAPDGRGKAGTSIDKTLLKGHRKKGGVIRLWPNEAVATGLAIAEGIENALAAAHVYTPVWASVDAGNLAVLPVLAGIESIVIVADYDAAGVRAADRCGIRWEDSGCEVAIIVPDIAGTDLADAAAVA